MNFPLVYTRSVLKRETSNILTMTYQSTSFSEDYTLHLSKSKFKGFWWWHTVCNYSAELHQLSKSFCDTTPQKVVPHPLSGDQGEDKSLISSVPCQATGSCPPNGHLKINVEPTSKMVWLHFIIQKREFKPPYYKSASQTLTLGLLI